MEVLRDNFHRELPYIKEAIEEAEFIAIDAEFSGLHTEPNKRTQNTTLEEGYEELRKSASQFLTVQIGISTFTFDPRNGTYIAKPFNFFIFPTTAVGFSPQGRCFLTEASSLDFLAKNQFDFNKWIYSGVHYMTKADEENFKKERIKMFNNDFDMIGVDPVHAPWLADVIARIKEWKNTGNALNFINIQTSNGYQKRLVHQEVRKLWGNELLAIGQGGHINITKTTEQQVNQQKQLRHAGLQREVENARGFRAVIDLLSTCGKPIVGHNVIIDLAYILAQFIGPLPPTMQEYKQMIHRTFPTVMDTKYISCTADAIKGLVHDSSLGGLESLVNTVDFMGCPRIMPHYNHQRYLSRDLSHEAGYDAYITGSILIRMMAHIARSEPPPPPPPHVAKEKNVKIDGKVERQPNGAPRRTGRNGKPVPNANPNNRAQPARSKASQAPSSTPAPAPASVSTSAVPKKLSYADAVHRSQNGTRPATSEAAVSPTVEAIQPPPPVEGKPEVEAEVDTDYHGQEDPHEDEGRDHYYRRREPLAEVHKRPFSIQSVSLKTYQNILHWGRSNHGCINLTSS